MIERTVTRNGKTYQMNTVNIGKTSAEKNAEAAARNHPLYLLTVNR